MFTINQRPEHYQHKELGEKPSIHPTCYVSESRLGDWTDLGPYTVMIESEMDAYSYTADNVEMVYSRIGKFCSIASHVRINPGNHPMERVSQHHFTYRRKLFGMDDHDDEAFFNWRRTNFCTIGHDVWIGHGVTIMPGVHVGTGAVIGAGAVVTKDVDPYMIVVGVPAKPLRARFSDSVTADLLRIAWWNWDHQTIRARLHEFLDTNAFIAKYR